MRKLKFGEIGNVLSIYTILTKKKKTSNFVLSTFYMDL